MSRTDDGWILAFLNDLEQYSVAHDLTDLAEDLRLLIRKHSESTHGHAIIKSREDAAEIRTDPPHLRGPVRKPPRVH